MYRNKRKNFATKRCLIDKIKTKMWFLFVSQHFGDATAYELENHFEPLDHSTTDERTQFRNKWSRYKRGTNTPSRKLLTRVELETPKSQEIIEHPFWAYLKQEKVVNIERWIKLLPSDFTSKMEKCLIKRRNEELQVVRNFVPTKNYLLRRASFDSLLAFSILWHCSSKKEFKQAYAEAIYDSLSVFCASGYQLELEMFSIFKHHVFLKTDFEYDTFKMNEENLKKQIIFFKEVVGGLKNIYPSKASAINSLVRYFYEEPYKSLVASLSSKKHLSSIKENDELAFLFVNRK